MKALSHGNEAGLFYCLIWLPIFRLTPLTVYNNITVTEIVTVRGQTEDIQINVKEWRAWSKSIRHYLNLLNSGAVLR